MCSELFRIPYEWGGVPIFGFGVLLALWAVASVVTLWVTSRRHGWKTETWSFVPVLLVAGAAILWLPKLFPDGLPIRGYGVMVLCGATLGIFLAVHRARQVGLNHELILSLAVWMFVAGIVGARMFFVIEYWDELFHQDSLAETLVAIARYTEGGLVIYGALIGASVAFVWFNTRHRLSQLAMADLIAPSLAFGLALGRIGCFLNGCCYGGPAVLPWAVSFPRSSAPYAEQVAQGLMHGVLLSTDEAGRPVVTSVIARSPAAETELQPGSVVAAIGGQAVDTLAAAERQLLDAFVGRQPVELRLTSGETVRLPAADPPERSRPVHPTQIYSAINAALLGWFLWTYYPFRRRDGEVIAWLLTIYPISRFLLEIIRTDESEVFQTGLSISQNISVVILLAVLGLWTLLLRQPRGTTWNLSPSS